MVVEVDSLQIHLDTRVQKQEGNKSKGAEIASDSSGALARPHKRLSWKRVVQAALGRLTNTAMVRQLIDNATLRVKTLSIRLSPSSPSATELTEDSTSGQTQTLPPDLLLSVSGLDASGLLEQSRDSRGSKSSRQHRARLYVLNKKLTIQHVSISFVYPGAKHQLWLHPDVIVACNAKITKSAPNARPSRVDITGTCLTQKIC